MRFHLAGALTTVIAATYCMPSMLCTCITLCYVTSCLWGLYKVINDRLELCKYRRNFINFMIVLAGVRFGMQRICMGPAFLLLPAGAHTFLPGHNAHARIGVGTP